MLVVKFVLHTHRLLRQILSVLEMCKSNITNIFEHCQFGAPIRNHGHSRIRTPISNTYRNKKSIEVYEELHQTKVSLEEVIL